MNQHLLTKVYYDCIGYRNLAQKMETVITNMGLRYMFDDIAWDGESVDRLRPVIWEFIAKN
jgi:hypothetical protein